jgi:hypothetical protein
MMSSKISSYFIFFPVFVVFFIAFNQLFMHFENFKVFSILSFIFALHAYKNFVDTNFVKLKKIYTHELYFPFTLFIILCTLSTFGYWLFIENLNIYNDTRAPMGSIETGQYANISKFIIDYNYIPDLKKNYAQSILAAFLNYSGLSFSASLSILLILAKAYTLTYIFLFLRKSQTIINSIVVASLFSIVGISLSTSSILIIDSGFPFLGIGYFDTVFSILTLMIFIFLKVSSNFKINNFHKFLFFVSWLIYAPQNLILFFFFYLIDHKNYKVNKIEFTLLLISIFYGFFSSGFFLQTLGSDANLINGVFVANNEINLIFSLGAHALIFNPDIYPNFSFNHIFSSTQLMNSDSLFHSIYFIVKYFFIIFVFMFLFFLGRINKNSEFVILNPSINKILFSSIIIFFALLFVDINNMKWQLQRFLIPSIFLSIYYFFYIALYAKSKQILIYTSVLLAVCSIGNFESIVRRIILFLNNESNLLLIRSLFNS